jgi:hypothetical protein
MFQSPSLICDPIIAKDLKRTPSTISLSNLPQKLHDQIMYLDHILDATNVALHLAWICVQSFDLLQKISI